YRVAKSIILREPLPSISVIECPCRAQKEDACLPRDVCLVVGEPFATFVVEHQETARRLTVEEALAIIDAEEERGHIHTAWFKESNHDRFYAICNCCSCCCLGMKSYFRGVPRIVHSGYKPVIDTELCSGCGSCTEYCHFKAIGEVDEFPEIDMSLCMGCGVCISHCPNEALSLALAPEKGVPLDIDVLIGQ
ncbi:MAG: ATP-binding protein, partial [Candidatus Saccharibacteria bacterium]